MPTKGKTLEAMVEGDEKYTAENNPFKTRAGPWKKGQSGNPGGMPKSLGEVIKLARENGFKALNRLIELIDDDDSKVALAASNAVLDRGYGKPKQVIDDVSSLGREEIERRALQIMKKRYGENMSEDPVVEPSAEEPESLQ